MYLFYNLLHAVLKMAVPFGCMLARTHVHCFDSIYMHTRCFASRRGTSAPLKNGDQLHVKSFFEKQITGGRKKRFIFLMDVYAPNH